MRIFRHCSLGLRASVMPYLLSYFSFCKSFLYEGEAVIIFILWKFCLLQMIHDLSSWTSISGFALQAPCINIGCIADHRVWGQHSFLGQPTGLYQSIPLCLYLYADCLCIAWLLKDSWLRWYYFIISWWCFSWLH